MKFRNVAMIYQEIKDLVTSRRTSGLPCDQQIIREQLGLTSQDIKNIQLYHASIHKKVPIVELVVRTDKEIFVDKMMHYLRENDYGTK